MPFGFNPIAGHLDLTSLVQNSDGTITVSASGLTYTVSLAVSHANSWTGQQYYPIQTLTNSGGVAWNWATQRMAQITGSGGASLALGFPSNLRPGGALIFLNQSATGGEKFTFADSRYKQGATLSGLVGNANGWILYECISNGTIVCVEAVDYA